jgi:hypothetical protein
MILPSVQPDSTEDSYVRIDLIVGDAKAKPPIEPLVPVSRSSIEKLGAYCHDG